MKFILALIVSVEAVNMYTHKYATASGYANTGFKNGLAQIRDVDQLIADLDDFIEGGGVGLAQIRDVDELISDLDDFIGGGGVGLAQTETDASLADPVQTLQSLL